MQRAEGVPAAPRLQVGLVGVALMLIGMIGDLVTHITAGPDHHEELISFGAGMNPWHLVLFGGIILTAAGAAWAAYGTDTRGGRVVGSAFASLTIFVVLAGGLVAAKAAREPQGAHVHVATAATTSHTHSAPAEQPQSHPTHSHQNPGAAGATEGTSFTGHHHAKAGPVTAEEQVVLKQQLAAAKAATRKYQSIARARLDGYFQVTQFLPGIGMHMANLALPDDVFDPATPQVLLYRPQGGQMVLAGVAYSIKRTSDVPPEGFAGDSDVWHFHKNLCFVSGVVTVTPTAEDCPGVFQPSTAWLVHAWIWTHNPHGVFTEYNPRVR